MSENTEPRQKLTIRRQHYVPRSYLCYFASSAEEDKGCIWTYDKKGGPPRLQSIVNSAVEKDIYSLKDSAPESPDYIETEIMTPVENAALSILNRLRNGEIGVFESPEFMKVIAFMALLHLRVPKTIETAKEFVEVGLREYMRLIGEDPQKMKELVERREKDKSSGNVLSETQLADALKLSEKHIKIEAKKEYVLGNILPQFSEIGKHLVQLNWSLCSTSEKSFFIISDVPLVVFCPFGEGRAKFGTGFALPDVQIHLPLTPNMCLFGARYTTATEWKMTKAEVDQANTRSIYSGHRFVFSPFKSNRIGKIVTKSALSNQGIRINKEVIREQLKAHIKNVDSKETGQ